MSKLLSVEASVCKSFSVRKGFLCVKILCAKTLVCKDLSVQTRLCVKAPLCKISRCKTLPCM